jgi:hypothetical protein
VPTTVPFFTGHRNEVSRQDVFSGFAKAYDECRSFFVTAGRSTNPHPLNCMMLSSVCHDNNFPCFLARVTARGADSTARATLKPFGCHISMRKADPVGLSTVCGAQLDGLAMTNVDLAFIATAVVSMIVLTGASPP